LNKLFPRTAWLDSGRLTTFEGPYEWARKKWAEQQVLLENEAPAFVPVERVKAVKVRSEEPRSYEAEIAVLEKDIAAIEAQAEGEEDWEVYESLMADKKKLEAKLDDLMAEWFKHEA
jgi:hypothetical protein